MNLVIEKSVAVILCVAAVCSSNKADDFVKLAVVDDNRIDESSGLAISYANPDAVWVHNDSGSKPQLFLVGLDGVTQAVVDIAHVKADDWEDMCSFQIDGASWLLIGDVGDNLHRRGKGSGHSACKLYLLKEPVIPAKPDSAASKQSPTRVSAEVSSTITFDYPDGPADCEGVAVDVERKEILLLTKNLLPHRCVLYKLQLNTMDVRQKVFAKRIASPFVCLATALDISPDGRTMAICTMFNGLKVTRTDEQTWTEAFDGAVTAFSLPLRKQGETICFDTTGKWLYVNSEEPQQPLWRVNIPK
ncbi:MAG: hypothetical protein P8K08_09930 [Fuerstiella sp.]|jgi:hypothetical protein|nr:hypothetical protein [Fuerstiella sp.]